MSGAIEGIASTWLADQPWQKVIDLKQCSFFGI